MTSFPGYWPAFNHKWVYRGKQCGGKKEHFYSQMSGESTKGGKSPQKKISESVRIRNWPSWLGMCSWAKLEAEWCLQQEKGQNWKWDNARSYWKSYRFQWIFRTTSPWIQICFFKPCHKTTLTFSFQILLSSFLIIPPQLPITVTLWLNFSNNSEGNLSMCWLKDASSENYLCTHHQQIKQAPTACDSCSSFFRRHSETPRQLQLQR